MVECFVFAYGVGNKYEMNKVESTRKNTSYFLFIPTKRIKQPMKKMEQLGDKKDWHRPNKNKIAIQQDAYR